MSLERVVAHELEHKGVPVDSIGREVEGLDVDLTAAVGDRSGEGRSDICTAHATDGIVLGAAQERRSGMVEELFDGSREPRAHEGKESLLPAAVLDDLADLAKVFDIGSLNLIDGDDEASAGGPESIGELGDL
ncbi:MAG: hypothetical protein ACTH8W_06250, partial [Brachybacterium tyrofermentans]